MKKIKIFCSILLAALMLSALVGCGKSYDFDLTEYLTIGDYNNLKIKQSDIDEKLKSTIDSLKEQSKETKDITDRPIKEGDIVNINYVGTIDGDEFEGGSGEGYDLTIGSNKFIEGFEAGLIGHGQTDKTVTLNLKFPSNYDKTEYAGKDVTFKVTINSIKADVTPEYNDEFIAAKTDYSTVEEYEEETTASIKGSLALEALMEASVAKKFPKDELKQEYKNYINNSFSSYQSQGMSIADVAKQYGMTMDQVYKNAADYAAYNVKLRMIQYTLIRNENITLSDDEYTKGAEKIIKLNSSYDSVDALEDAFSKDEIKDSILFEKVNKWLGEKATVINDAKNSGSTNSGSANSGKANSGTAD